MDFDAATNAYLTAEKELIRDRLQADNKSLPPLGGLQDIYSLDEVLEVLKKHVAGRLDMNEVRRIENAYGIIQALRKLGVI